VKQDCGLSQMSLHECKEAHGAVHHNRAEHDLRK
jgi:hypothetical protein